MSEAGYFSKNYDAFRRLQEEVAAYSPQSQGEEESVELIQVALKAISFNREEYDSLAPYTTSQRGEGFLKLIREPLGPAVLSRILGGLAAFIREATLLRETRSDSEQVILDQYLGTVSTSEDWAGYDSDYVRNVLPAKLIEAQRKGLGQLRADFEKASSDAFAQANALEERVQGHQEQLKKLESQFNFVGLTHAFRELLSAKIRDQTRTFVFALALGLLAIAIPVFFVFHWDGAIFANALAGWSPSAISRLGAAVGAEIVILYYFRIVLTAYLLAQNQVTNLQLRVALCTFVEGYVDFSKKTAGGLAGFEALIFSSLPNGDGKLPATLEGIEQVARITESLKR